MAAKAIALVKSGALLPTSLWRWAQARYRRGLTTRASPDSEAGRGPVLGPRRRRLFLFPDRASTCPAVLRNAEAGETLLCGPDWPLEALKRGSDGGASKSEGCHRRAGSGHHVVARAPSPQPRLTWHGPP